MSVQLSHIPSVLIRTGLRDLRKIERNPKYKVNMDDWHTPIMSDQSYFCHVCLSGSVMAMTLKIPDHIYMTPYSESFSEHNKVALRALNCFIEIAGRVAGKGISQGMGTGCRLLNAKPVRFDMAVPRYKENKVGFHEAMEALAQTFENSGQ